MVSPDYSVWPQEIDGLAKIPALPATTVLSQADNPPVVGDNERNHPKHHHVLGQALDRLENYTSVPISYSDTTKLGTYDPSINYTKNHNGVSSLLHSGGLLLNPEETDMETNTGTPLRLDYRFTHQGVQDDIGTDGFHHQISSIADNVAPTAAEANKVLRGDYFNMPNVSLTASFPVGSRSWVNQQLRRSAESLIFGIYSATFVFNWNENSTWDDLDSDGVGQLTRYQPWRSVTVPYDSFDFGNPNVRIQNVISGIATTTHEYGGAGGTGSLLFNPSIRWDNANRQAILSIKGTFYSSEMRTRNNDDNDVYRFPINWRDTGNTMTVSFVIIGHRRVDPV
jgi:hypothetical protein